MFSHTVGKPPLGFADVYLLALGAVDAVDSIPRITSEATADLPVTFRSVNMSGSVNDSTSIAERSSARSASGTRRVRR